MAPREGEARAAEQERAPREALETAGFTGRTGHGANVSCAGRGPAGDRQTIVVAALHGVPDPSHASRPSDDPIFALNAEARARAKAGESIVNATVGAMLDDEGRLAVLPSVGPGAARSPRRGGGGLRADLRLAGFPARRD